MKWSSVLTVILILAVALWLISLGLFVELSQHDPYGWAFPGRESVRSRNLYNQRSNLYVSVGVISFLIAALLGLVKLIIHRHRLVRKLFK